MDLTLEDISDEVLHTMEREVEQQTKRVEELRGRLALLQQELVIAEEQRTSGANALLWRRLMADVERDKRVSDVTAAMACAIEEFRKSLIPPPDYDEKSEGIPFVDSDDYADMSPVECLMDELMESILQLVAEGGDEQARERRHRAMLMLLVLTVNFGRLAEMPEAKVTEETEELQESLTAMWQRLLYTDAGLSQAEKDEWKHVVKTFLGAPYDTPA